MEVPGLNLYTYVSNDPLNQIDPVGLASVILVNLDAPGSQGVATGRQMAVGALAEMGQGKIHYLVPYNSTVSPMSGLQALKDKGVRIDQLFLVDHGAPGALVFGNGNVVVPGNMTLILKTIQIAEPCATMCFYNCFAAGGSKSEQLLQQIADASRRPIEGYTGATYPGVGGIETTGQTLTFFPNNPLGTTDENDYTSSCIPDYSNNADGGRIMGGAKSSRMSSL